MAKDTTATWHEIDPATLKGDTQKLYAAYKAQYAITKAARETFEESLRKDAPSVAGKRVAIAYNFGKLSIAMVDDTGTKGVSKKATSLADALKAA